MKRVKIQGLRASINGRKNARIKNLKFSVNEFRGFLGRGIFRCEGRTKGILNWIEFTAGLVRIRHLLIWLRTCFKRVPDRIFVVSRR